MGDVTVSLLIVTHDVGLHVLLGGECGLTQGALVDTAGIVLHLVQLENMLVGKGLAAELTAERLEAAVAAHVQLQVLLVCVAFAANFACECGGGHAAALVLHTVAGNLITFFTPPQLAFEARQLRLGGHALALMPSKVLLQSKRLEAEVANAGNLAGVGLLVQDQLCGTLKVFGADVAAQLGLEEGLVVDVLPGGGLVSQHLVVLQVDKSVIEKYN